MVRQGVLGTRGRCLLVCSAPTRKAQEHRGGGAAAGASRNVEGGRTSGVRCCPPPGPCARTLSAARPVVGFAAERARGTRVPARVPEAAKPKHAVVLAISSKTTSSTSTFVAPE
jgi:hypothetical protein